MSSSLLEMLCSIPDHRRAEGKRFDLATVLLYAILGTVAKANSYRQMLEFIRIHRQRLNEAFGLSLPYGPSYTGLRGIIQGVDAHALEAAFRSHASLVAPSPEGMIVVAIDGKTLRGSFDAFADRKAAHLLSALRQVDKIVLGHVMVDEKSNEIPAAPALIEALGVGDVCSRSTPNIAKKTVRTRDRFGQSPAGPSPAGPSRAQSTKLAPQAQGRGRWPQTERPREKPSQGSHRWETRELTLFPVKAWFRDTPWENLIKTVLRLKRTVYKRDPKTGRVARTDETVFWVSSADGIAPECWNEWIRGHWRIENASHYVRAVAFAEDASRIRKNPDIVARLRSFAHNLLRASGADNIQNTRYRAALDLTFAVNLTGTY